MINYSFLNMYNCELNILLNSQSWYARFYHKILLFYKKIIKKEWSLLLLGVLSCLKCRNQNLPIENLISASKIYVYYDTIYTAEQGIKLTARDRM